MLAITRSIFFGGQKQIDLPRQVVTAIGKFF